MTTPWWGCGCTKHLSVLLWILLQSCLVCAWGCFGPSAHRNVRSANKGRLRCRWRFSCPANAAGFLQRELSHGRRGRQIEQSVSGRSELRHAWICNVLLGWLAGCKGVLIPLAYLVHSGATRCAIRCATRCCTSMHFLFITWSQ